MPFVENRYVLVGPVTSLSVFKGPLSVGCAIELLVAAMDTVPTFSMDDEALDANVLPVPINQLNVEQLRQKSLVHSVINLGLRCIATISVDFSHVGF